MNEIDVRSLAKRLTTIESIAHLPCVTSTNTLARRMVAECIENDIAIPEAILIAEEQSEGRGRGERTWHSPAGKGIYATVLHTLPAEELSILPLRIAAIVAEFLRETYGIDARIKWPNDILAGGRKIAGILIEARNAEDDAYAIIGVGINVLPSESAPENATSIAEVSKRDAVELESATVAFVEHVDRELGLSPSHSGVIDRWLGLTIHRTGDRVSCHLGAETIDGVWDGINDDGHALIRVGDTVRVISAGDVIPRE